MNQSVRALPQPRALSAHESLEFRWERFGLIAKELPPLFRRHWREIAVNQDKVPLDPDWPRYFEMDLQGVLRVLTVRANGFLVGYVFCLVGPHLHYAGTPWCQVDMFWLDPAYRQGWTGYRMLRTMLRGIKELGAKVVYIGEKVHFEQGRGGVGKLLQRLGFAPRDVMYAKYIGD